MTAEPGKDRAGRSLTLFALAALIAAVAMLVFAVTALVLVWSELPRNVDQAADSSSAADVVAPLPPPVEGEGAAASAPEDAAAVPIAPEAGASAATAAGATSETAATALPAPIAFPDTTVVATVEDWLAFGDAAAVEATIERNLGAGTANTMTLTLLDLTGSPGGQGGLGIDYEIGEDAPDDFVGFNRTLDEIQDWRGATHLALWVEPGSATTPDLVFQFRETSGEVWRYTGPLGGLRSDVPLMLPLAADTFTRADWSTEANGEIDLDAIDQYGIYIGHVGPGITGTLNIGVIGAVAP